MEEVFAKIKNHTLSVWSAVTACVASAFTLWVMQCKYAKNFCK